MADVLVGREAKDLSCLCLCEGWSIEVEVVTWTRGGGREGREGKEKEREGRGGKKGREERGGDMINGDLSQSRYSILISFTVLGGVL